MENRRTKLGIIGCGNISGIYLTVCPTFDLLEVAACADVVLERAEAQAAKYGVPVACSPADLLRDPEIEIVVNLTIPRAHGEVALAALAAGKSVYSEKPLALTRAEGQEILQQARAGGLRMGGAPDTFLGGGLQTCRKLIDDGWIGTPVAATAFMLGHGPENWHPDPEFFYQPGAGPLFDMGPYYLTALIALLGPVRRVTSSARITTPERIIGSEPKRGTRIAVNTPTHVAGVLDFASGPVAMLVTSFDVWSAEVPRIEIYGTAGSLSLPDPNTFGGPVRVRRAGAEEWSTVPIPFGYTQNSRGLGVADMAYAMRSGRPHRANGDLTYHVLDIMHALLEASDAGRHIDITSTCTRPAPLPLDLPPNTLDL
jgi:predicted dehydrogenase